jgi:Tfp pilus assembly protein PilX
MRRNDERGMTLVIAMFMVLMVSALGAAMVQVARTETLSSATYMSMSQARYAAESGVASAANYLLSSAYGNAMPGTGANLLTEYNLDVSPVTMLLNGNAVVLSSDPGVTSNYPTAAVVTAFQNATTGTLDVDNGRVAYTARARLLGMRQIADGITGDLGTLQTWEIVGVGRRAIGLNSGEVEVLAIIERTTRPVFAYAAFATANGCSALTFSGSATSGSYDSTEASAGTTPPSSDDEGGHVGTNGNLDGGGSADINGTLSTPMAGVGACTANNVTAATIAGMGAVSEGLIQLPQAIDFPTPPEPPLAMVRTDNLTINGNSCPVEYLALGICAATSGQTTWTPQAGAPVSMGNVTLSGNSTVYLTAGTYYMNSLTIQGNNRIAVDPASGGEVKIILVGEGSVTKVLDVTGNGLSNSTWDPTLLQFQYHGDKIIEMDGNGNTASLIYAPNAQGRFWGNADFYGSVIMRTMNFGGNAGIHYDNNLQRSILTIGNPVMSTFTGRTFEVRGLRPRTPYWLSRAPLRRRAPFARLVRCAHSR